MAPVPNSNTRLPSFLPHSPGMRLMTSSLFRNFKVSLQMSTYMYKQAVLNNVLLQYTVHLCLMHASDYDILSFYDGVSFPPLVIMHTDWTDESC